MGAIISRFAPAPTGFLHLGHVVNALFVWKTAGRVLLRIEDHDRQRSRLEFEAAIFEDLDWLGFVADEPAVRQSERDDIYLQALEGLRRQGLVYACSCSRADIERAGLKACATSDTPAGAIETLVAQPFPPPLALNSSELRRDTPKRHQREGGRAADDELRYPGTCRDLGLADAPGLGLRVRLDPRVERFIDMRHGAQEQNPSKQCGDLLLRDREGNWTYQFAATVDDYVQGVTHVIRGDDLLASTGRQIQLARLLGRPEPPVFLHHPLIMKSVASAGGFGVPGQKLSKSDGDTGIRELRARGWSPADVIARARELMEGTD